MGWMVDWNRGAWVGTIAVLATACGDDAGNAPGDESSSSSSTMTVGESSSGMQEESSSSNVDSSGSSSSGNESSSSSEGSSSGSTGSESSSGESSSESSSGTDTETMASGGAVDVLFVVDNTSSMGLEQAKLVEAIAGFVEALDEANVDWRIGVTTTDDGNPWCGSTSPEAGKLRSTSCRSRLGEFVFAGADPIDATDESCLDICGYDSISIEATATDLDPTPLPRPWIQNIGGVHNVGDGVSPTEALACLLPQGIDGCGFEQPLDSMRKTLLRAVSSEESEYGFLRDDALTAIVFVTDEADCTYDDDWVSIFLPEEDGGNEVFWSDPEAIAPTSAVCWNAGTVCTGGPGTYDECHAANLGVDGNEVADEDDAVLRPLSDFADLLGDDVYVAAIDGVPVGYDDGSADMVFADDPDPLAQIAWGIGAGCTNGTETAVPSVRIRELVETVDGGERNDFSICDDSYAIALDTIAARILARIAR